ncbi:MAG: sigma 54-interacting transcriptional regulator [Pyrinomonadaceae bacterium]|nr:sigma 54-interacting transcriptional regulator [Pyrinomonadaceae bacterium]
MSKNLLETIQTIIQILNDSQIPKSNFSSVLETLAARFDVSRSFLLIYQTASDKLNPVAVNGLNAADFRRLENKVEKTIFRTVFEKGKVVIVPRLSLENTLKFLPMSETETSLIVLPIVLENQKLGVFAAEFLYRENSDLKEAKLFLSVVVSLIAQTFKIENAVSTERKKLSDENSHLRQELKEKYDFSHIIGNSGPMRRVYNQVSQVARSNATVLLRGESGTGKEMIAHAIHYNSLRSKQAFIKINCAALPETLVESELFGYEKGAFTGADKRKKGRFEMADGGTLFLDEIGDLPLPTQIKLLRVLQEKEFERLGGTETIKVNVRLITATNKNLEDEIAKAVFREDLFYRLNVFTIFLPPLRERKSDILFLAEHFLGKYERVHGKNLRRISTPAIDMLTAYHYPGNVRELENAIERAIIVCDENVLHGHHLPPTLQTAAVSDTVTKLTLSSAVAAFESDLIQDTLKTTGGNCAQAAILLDTTERIINYKILKYEINPKRFRK